MYYWTIKHSYAFIISILTYQFNYNLQSRYGPTFPRERIIEAILRHKLLQFPPRGLHPTQHTTRHINLNWDLLILFNTLKKIKAKCKKGMITVKTC